MVEVLKTFSPKYVGGHLKLHSQPTAEALGKPQQPGLDGMAETGWGISLNDENTRNFLIDAGLGGGVGRNHNQVSLLGRVGFEQLFDEDLRKAFAFRLGISQIINNSDSLKSSDSKPHISLQGEVSFFNARGDAAFFAGLGVHIPMTGDVTKDERGAGVGLLVPYAILGWRFAGLFENSFLPPPKQDSSKAEAAYDRVLKRWSNIYTPDSEGFFPKHVRKIALERAATILEERLADTERKYAELHAAVQPTVAVFKGSELKKERLAAYEAAARGLPDRTPLQNGDAKPTLKQTIAEEERNLLRNKLTAIEDYLAWLTAKAPWPELGLQSFDEEAVALKKDLEILTAEGSAEKRKLVFDFEDGLKFYKQKAATKLANEITGAPNHKQSNQEVTGLNLDVYNELKASADAILDMFFGETAKPVEARKIALDDFEKILAKYNTVYTGLKALLGNIPTPQLDKTARLANWLRTGDKKYEDPDVKEKLTIPAMRRALPEALQATTK